MAMIITEKAGRLRDFDIAQKQLEIVHLEWYETMKRILHKKTVSGTAITLRFLNEAQHLQQDDVIYADEEKLIVIDVLPCEAIVIQPLNMFEMALVCYEIGNKHLPLFYEADQLLIPYEAPIFNMLKAAGFKATMEKRKLLDPLKTSVVPHLHSGTGTSLFSKIMQLTSKAADAK